ncbi:hypothetical protein GPECTOR_112g267 [Gonium pectorale]|uniref:Uncharacterized protein n=1 Tax=Gonium pectorale TaxID=33097 RepID=A0A150FZ85_GONPE|nr:hypothetical protein GPECTOR_112g267 [Gonium pectorale]|eukprot:KXZ42897.1 hypothetical protein GPECTOR_112g267 [Gonium pectorale]
MAVGRYFCFKERKAKFTTEIRAGTVTFLTMAYILAVNGAIVSDTGGPCTVHDCTYNKGQERAKRSMVSATAIGSFVSCMLMGLVGNLPFGLAPGMGANAFFAYTVVGFFGTGGMVSYQDALAASFCEGLLFILISVVGLRGKLTSLVPKSLMLATSGGIGLFLAFIGLQTNEGIGLVSFDPATLVTLGGCKLEDRAYMYTVKDTSSVCRIDDAGRLVANLGPASVNYRCYNQMKMRSASMWLGILGGLLMVLLMARGFRAAIMIATLFVTFVSWIPGHEASYLGASSQIAGGEERLVYFKKVVSMPDATFTALKLRFSAFGTSQLWMTILSDLYLDLLDSTGTFFSMANYINKRLPGFVDPVKKTFPRMTLCYCADASAVCVAALLGLPPINTYVESATGIREGGRTGITAIVIGLYFGASMFLTPTISSIPPYATGPALILVGALMMENLLDIDWKDYTHAIPAFITIAVVPMTYSIAYGILAGILSYLALYILLLVYDLATLPFTDKTLASVLAAAKPECLKPYTQLEAEELERNRRRIQEMDAELREMEARARAAEAAAAQSKLESKPSSAMRSIKIAAVSTVSFALSTASSLVPSGSVRGSRVFPAGDSQRTVSQATEVSVRPRSRASSGGGGGCRGGGSDDDDGGGGDAGGNGSVYGSTKARTVDFQPTNGSLASPFATSTLPPSPLLSDSDSGSPPARPSGVLALFPAQSGGGGGGFVASPTPSGVAAAAVSSLTTRPSGGAPAASAVPHAV